MDDNNGVINNPEWFDEVNKQVSESRRNKDQVTMGDASPGNDIKSVNEKSLGKKNNSLPESRPLQVHSNGYRPVKKPTVRQPETVAMSKEGSKSDHPVKTTSPVNKKVEEDKQCARSRRKRITNLRRKIALQRKKKQEQQRKKQLGMKK